MSGLECGWKCGVVWACLLVLCFPAMGQEDGAAKGEGASGGRTVALWGHVKDAFTYVGIPDVFITLMRADSTVVDTMGAGDSFIAGFLYGLMRGEDIPACMALGAENSSVTLGYAGAW